MLSVGIIAQQMYTVQWINVALCQAAANISTSLVHISLIIFFFTLLLSRSVRQT